MATKLRKSTKPKPAAEKPEKSQKTERIKKIAPDDLKKDRVEKVDLKELAKDERTWKILGTVSLLVSIFLFVACFSYLFTWKEDQSQVMNRGLGYLFESGENGSVANLVGRLGAYVSHQLVFKGFGLASFLFSTFFFVVGVNLLFNSKIFSITRNLKYVTIGLIIASVVFSFVLPNAIDSFPYGGHVGNLINEYLVSLLGKLGTAALLLVVGFSYLIWQFNPSFQLPQKKVVGETTGELFETTADTDSPVFSSVTINDLYADQFAAPVDKGNYMKGEGKMVLMIDEDDDDENENNSGLELIEKDDDDEVEDVIPAEDPVTQEVIDDILHNNDLPPDTNENVRTEMPKNGDSDKLQLQIKTPEPDIKEEVVVKNISELPPYE
ncbi:MAG TPA: DNA translocase FtsK 4TM domain-containing protein, partial [Flavisolibacter sp.]|nr:DNA translocase FtsK 4TM domain-containing protein [Flavisolibacter sp.]